jgi:TusA-related sulfurtransferase
MRTRTQLDLRGVPCPLSWAKCKVALAALAVGDVIDLTLDDPRGARDLPRAAEAEGHHVLEEQAAPGQWHISIEK